MEERGKEGRGGIGGWGNEGRREKRKGKDRGSWINPLRPRSWNLCKISLHKPVQVYKYSIGLQGLVHGIYKNI